MCSSLTLGSRRFKSGGPSPSTWTTPNCLEAHLHPSPGNTKYKNPRPHRGRAAGGAVGEGLSPEVRDQGAQGPGWPACARFLLPPCVPEARPRI